MLFAKVICANNSRNGPCRVSKDSFDLVGCLTEGALHSQLSNGTISQRLLRLGLEDSLWDGGILTIIGFSGGGTVVLVLLRVHSEALSDEVNLNSVDVLNQTSDRRHQLLHDVPIDIGLKSSTTLHDLIETIGSFLKRKLLVGGHTASLLFFLLVF